MSRPDDHPVGDGAGGGSGSEDRRPVGGDGRPSTAGAMTAVGGTPIAVDISHDRRARVIWAVFLAGPVIWFAHFMLVYLVVEAGCTGEGSGLSAFAPPVPTIVTLAATVVAAAACLGAAWWGWRRWRGHTDDPEAGVPGQVPGDHADDDHGGTLAIAGFGLSLLSFVSVLLIGVPALVLPAC